MIILCEKPSVAKEFAHVLGCAGKKGYYERGNTIITYCVGHLYELCTPETYNPALKTWRLEDLPIIPRTWRYEPVSSAEDQAKIVITLLKHHAADEMLIATDAGREGELIARIVLHEAGIDDTSRCRRFWVSEALTEKVIQEGIKRAKPLNEYDAVSRQGFARQHADWLVGINLTRYMSIGNREIFSVGRVQTAILSAIALRNEETGHFVPKPYLELEAAVTAKDGKTITAVLVNPETERTAFGETEREYVREAEQYCQTRPPVRGEAETAQRTEKPEKLLNITGLQKKAYKLYGYSPDKTLETAQALYEKHKCLSYPRTPSRVMGDNNVDLFREKYELLKAAYPDLSQYTDAALIIEGNKHIFNSAALEDHHALIPLKELPEGVTDEERNVYGIVIRSFFTVCMRDFIYTEKKIRFTGGSYTFRRTIKEIIQEGWKASVPKKQEEEEIPEVAGFDEKECRITGAKVLAKKTTPPKEYSIDTLLAFMENPKGERGEKLSGLGTPATRAEILKTLMTRAYINEKGKTLYVTEKGWFLLRGMRRDEALKKLTDVELTSGWEQELAENPEAFEEHITNYIRSCIKKDQARETYQKEGIGVCPLCGNQILDGKKNYYCAGYKTEKQCKFVIWKETAGTAISPEDARLLLTGKPTRVKNCKSKTGKQFKASFKLEKGILTMDFPEDKKAKGRNRR
jgi:DNA topoisomerase-3